MIEPPLKSLPPSATKRRDALKPISIFDEVSIKKRFLEEGIPEIHAFKIWRYIIQRGVENIRDIPDLPKIAYQLIENEFQFCISTLEQCNNSSDGSTTKLLIKLQDGRYLEAVIMRYGSVELCHFPEDRPKYQDPEKQIFKSNKRATLCVSSQVGCQMGCTFCATGTMGLQSNLTAGEILEQLYIALKFEKIRNIVFMGMGEPLDNYSEVISAIEAMTDVRRFNLSSHRIAVSTVGVAPRIKQLARDAPGISLALSLHAPNQELRSQIVPSSKSWKINKIMEATDFFISHQKALTQTMNKKQVIMFEYVLIKDVNDSSKLAKELGELLGCRSSYAHLNIIPYNPTLSSIEYEAPSQENIDEFIRIVREHGVKATVRQELGQDIGSACGQLVVSQERKDKQSKNHSQNAEIEDYQALKKINSNILSKTNTHTSDFIDGATTEQWKSSKSHISSTNEPKRSLENEEYNRSELFLNSNINISNNCIFDSNSNSPSTYRHSTQKEAVSQNQLHLETPINEKPVINLYIPIKTTTSPRVQSHSQSLLNSPKALVNIQKSITHLSNQIVHDKCLSNATSSLLKRVLDFHTSIDNIKWSNFIPYFITFTFSFCFISLKISHLRNS